MALYTYKAIDANGKTVLGRVDAANPFDLEQRLWVAIGNELWVYVGMSSGLYAMTLFCGISGIILASLALLNWRSRTPPRR